MTWFIDWASGSFPWKDADEINDGHIVYLKAGGSLEFSVDRRLQVVGSHSSTCAVLGHGDSLRFSGNPTKFLQGHNLFGGNRLEVILPNLGAELARLLDSRPSSEDQRKWKRGEIRLTRVDLTRMYRPAFARPGWVPKWLAIASGVAHGGRQRTANRGAYDANTLYVGQNSRRVTLKLYDKEAESRRHPIPAEILDASTVDLLAYVANTLRVEVELKAMELKKRDLRFVKDWTPAIGDQILDERMSRLELNDTIRMSEDMLDQLPRRLAGVYGMWRLGIDIRSMYSRATFYRYRSDLKAFGVDILNVRPHIVHEDALTPMGRPLGDYLAGGALRPPAADPASALAA